MSGAESSEAKTGAGQDKKKKKSTMPVQENDTRENTGAWPWL